jgi:hypothetical protein
VKKSIQPENSIAELNQTMIGIRKEIDSLSLAVRSELSTIRSVLEDIRTALADKDES